MSEILAIGILLFVGVASGVLLWAGLAARSRGQAATRGRARAQIAVGALGFAIALWFLVGLLSRAR